MSAAFDPKKTLAEAFARHLDPYRSDGSQTEPTGLGPRPGSKIDLERFAHDLEEKGFTDRLEGLDRLGLGLTARCQPIPGGFSSYPQKQLEREQYIVGRVDESFRDIEKTSEAKSKAAEVLEEHCKKHPDHREFIAEFVTAIPMNSIDSWADLYRGLPSEVTSAMETLRQPYSQFFNFHYFSVKDLPPPGMPHSEWCGIIKAAYKESEGIPLNDLINRVQLDDRKKIGSVLTDEIQVIGRELLLKQK